MHKVKWYGVSVVLLLLNNTTPVWARFGGGHGGGASGVSGYSRGAPNWLAWLGLLILQAGIKVSLMTLGKSKMVRL